MALGDLDNDGEEELLTIEPFHGDVVRIWKRNDSEWKAIYQVPFSMPFSHALWCGKLNGKTCAVLGYRQQEQALCIVEFNNRKFTTHMIDKGIGPANVWCFDYRGKSYIVSANREHNELALYLVI